MHIFLPSVKQTVLRLNITVYSQTYETRYVTISLYDRFFGRQFSGADHNWRRDWSPANHRHCRDRVLCEEAP